MAAKHYGEKGGDFSEPEKRYLEAYRWGTIALEIGDALEKAQTDQAAPLELKTVEAGLKHNKKDGIGTLAVVPILGILAWAARFASWAGAVVLFVLAVGGLGFSATQVETLVDARPMLDRDLNVAAISGRVAMTDIMPDGIRLTLISPFSPNNHAALIGSAWATIRQILRCSRRMRRSRASTASWTSVTVFCGSTRQ